SDSRRRLLTPSRARAPWCRCELPFDLVDELGVQVQKPAQEAGGEQEVLLAVWELACALVRLVEKRTKLFEVDAQRREALAGDLLADEVAEQQPHERVALQRGDGDRRACVVGQRAATSLRKGVDGALSRLPRFLACVEVPEPGEALRFDVVLALAGPVEDAAVLGHPQQVVCACAALADETEDLVGEQRQLVVDRTMSHSL